MKYVYVIAKNGEPLMPTCRYGHVRRLLKEKKARVVRREPFTIQLQYETTEYRQPLVLGIDPGASTIGMAVRRANGEIVFAGELTLRSRQVTEKMTERRMHRRSRRTYRRLRRIRRARKAKTRFKAKQYRIVGIKEPLICKEIRPKLSRFHNRNRRKGWLTPTAHHLLESHQNFVKKMGKMLPIAKVVLEYAQFDVHKLVNPEVQGKEYQEGRQKGYDNEREYVLQRDQYTCQLCQKTEKELHVHHVIWQSDDGGDVPENLLTLCVECHDRVHKNPEVDRKVKELFVATKKRYVHPTLLNTIMAALYMWLCKELREVKVTYGYETKEKRREYDLWKGHYVDAYVASLNSGQITIEKPCQTAKQELLECVVYEFVQFRRHNRQMIHSRRDRNYYEEKSGEGDEQKAKSKIVAKNRHQRMGQTSDSLAEYVAKKGKEHLDTLKVTKGQKMIRSKKEKYRAGDVALRKNKTTGIVTGTGHKGYSVMLRDEKNYVVARECKPLLKNTGIVCVGYAQSEKTT